MAAASTIAAITAIASVALSTISAVKQGKAAQAQVNFQDAVRNQQAELQRQQAERERQLTAVQEAQLRRQQARDLASARTRFAAGGRDTSSGSALLLQEDAAAQNEFAALLNRSIGLERAHALENQVNLAGLRESEIEFQKAVTRQRNRFDAGTSLLRGASSALGAFGSTR